MIQAENADRKTVYGAIAPKTRGQTGVGRTTQSKTNCRQKELQATGTRTLKASGINSRLCPTKNDRLYQAEAVPEDFEFNERVVEVFSTTCSTAPFLSIMKVIKAAALLIDLYLEPGDRGLRPRMFQPAHRSLSLPGFLNHKKLRLEGIDNSLPMLEKSPSEKTETLFQAGQYPLLS